jgi:CMP-N-acetylneuraminic acid synthetase
MFLAIIPARSGSKRIKNKNLRKINNKPLIYYAIKHALKSKYIKETIVLTDSEKIKKKSEQYGAKVPFLRPKKISLDKTPMLETVQYALDKLKIYKHKDFKYMVLLPVTSPLRNLEDIDGCCKKILNNQKADSLVTTYKVKESYHPSKIMSENKKKFIKKIKYDNKKNYFVRNGPAVLITKIIRLKKYLLGGKIINYVMPYERSIDINYKKDLKKAMILMK